MRAIFVTDPICSWCWGTLPEIATARAALSDRIDFVLVMSGLQIGTGRALSPREEHRLKRLWREVGNTTGVRFSGRVPADFIYHSELACRAVEVVRRETGSEPWAFFARLQSAFYEDARNPSDIATLADLALIDGVSQDTLAAGIRDADIINTVRAQFEWASAHAAHALPSLLTHHDGDRARLLSGGYVTADYLVPALHARLADRAPAS